MKTAEEWAVEMWQPLKERFISGDLFAANMKPFIEAIQQDAFKAGELKGVERLSEACKTKLREISKGEYNTWGFVQMFFNILDKEQESIRQHVTSLGGGE